MPVNTHEPLSSSAYNSLSTPPPPALRTLGVHKSANHTAQSQLMGWTTLVGSCFELLSQTPLGDNLQVDSRIFGIKLRAILTDHASDQKLLVSLIRDWKTRCDRELRGEAVLRKMTKEERLDALSTHLREACSLTNGWGTLSADQQSTMTHDAWLTLAYTLGEKDFSSLIDEEKNEACFFVWTGCCMHKELNAVKGGVAAMGAAWFELKLEPPIPLRNKFESAASIGGSQADPQVKSESSRGAAKLTMLAGAIFNHKDDKKGQHHTYKYHFEVSNIVLKLFSY